MGFSGEIFVLNKSNYLPLRSALFNLPCLTKSYLSTSSKVGISVEKNCKKYIFHHSKECIFSNKYFLTYFGFLIPFFKQSGIWSNCFRITENYEVTWNIQKQSPKVFYEKVILKNFSIFTGKCLRWSFFLMRLRVIKKRLHIGAFQWILLNF